MPSISTGESAGILIFLMKLPRPTAAEATAVNGGIAWLQKVAIHDVAWRSTPAGRDLVAAPGAGSMWARYYQIGTNRPLFGDRDKTIHDKIAEISLERRNGYAWYGTAPQKALDLYQSWHTSHR
jgi:PelA/Pel-15E family pectate lyase